MPVSLVVCEVICKTADERWYAAAAAACFWFGFFCSLRCASWKIQVFIAALFTPKEAADHTSRTTAAPGGFQVFGFLEPFVLP